MFSPAKELLATLSDLAETTRTSACAPGLGLSVFTADEVLLERGFGARDREAGLPVTPETIFGVASITKSFTALTTLTLQERDELRLADGARRYFDFGPLWAEGAVPRVEHFLTTRAACRLRRA